MVEISGLRLEIMKHLASVGAEVQSRDLEDRFPDEKLWDSLDYLEEKGTIEVSSEGLGIKSKGYTITLTGRKLLRNLMPE